MADLVTNTFEIGPIRPPSEAYSLLLRITRNCPWNRCRFCDIYKGKKFELRPVADIEQEIDTTRQMVDQIKEIAKSNSCSIQEAAAMILNNPPSEAFYSVALWQYSGGESVFLQDANTLIMPTDQLVEVLQYLKATFSDIKRITSYGRSHTAARKTVEDLVRLKEAGLSRLHIGLESGHNPVLEYVDKGITADDHIKGGRNIKASGIELSEYLLLGLGGKAMTREHALESARVLSAIDPDFIRIRTLTVKTGMLMYPDVAAGKFVRLTDDELAAEERLFIENLNCTSYLASDHATNLFQEIEGRLPESKPHFLEIIDRFLALEPEERMNYKLGRRMNVYLSLDDLDNEDKRNTVERFKQGLISSGRGVNDDAIFWLMERFV
ncbi:MAG: radical SAM protein [Dehalococcoidales bacterium]|nr:radical SAM protein [Dehalococcoidales bacterium]